jgi:hypothetical protein
MVFVSAAILRNENPLLRAEPGKIGCSEAARALIISRREAVIFIPEFLVCILPSDFLFATYTSQMEQCLLV